MKEQLRFRALPVEQPIGKFFVATLSGVELLRMCRFDYRRMHFRNGYVDFLGIQRELDPRRVKQISSFSGTVDACFPTSIVISIDQKCVSLIEDDCGIQLIVEAYTDPEDSSLSIPLDEAATIIDGQHRLKGLSESGHDFELSVTIFIGADDAIEALLFTKVNLAQTKVNRSLAYDLFAVARERSPERTCHEITVALDRSEQSPFRNKIKRLGVATEGRFGETLSQATIVSGILPYISNDPDGDRDRGKRFGFWEPISAKDHSRRIFYEFFRQKQDVKILENIVNYFNAVKERWPVAWESNGRGIMIQRTNGFNGFCRFLRPAYLYFASEPSVVPKSDFALIFKEIKLQDSDFNTLRYVPGTSGATQLYNDLRIQSRVG